MSLDGIVDKIITDAKAEAQDIITKAKEEARVIQAEGEREAERYFGERRARIDELYRREMERAILNKKLESRKNILLNRQEWMEKAFSLANKRLVAQPLPEYGETITGLIAKVSKTKDEEVVFGKKGDDGFLKKIVGNLNKKTKGNFTLSRDRGDFIWGFILKKGKVETNMTIDSLFKYKRADLEQKAWELFNAGV